MSAEMYLLSILCGCFFAFFLMVYWFVFAGPKRAVAAIKSKSPESDRSIAIFKDANPQWSTYRLLPLPGLKTLWKIETSYGKSIGSIEIGVHLKRPVEGNNVQIFEENFKFRKNVEGFIQNGFVIVHQGKEYFLKRDVRAGVFSTLSHNFRDLILEDSILLEVKGQKNQSLIMFKNGKKIGIASHPRGFYPGFVIMDPDVSELDRAILFYCMLIH